MTNVVMSGWQAPVQKILLVKLLHAHAGLSLADAKHTVDRILERDPVLVSVPSVVAAERLAEAAGRLGVSAIIDGEHVEVATPTRAS